MGRCCMQCQIAWVWPVVCFLLVVQTSYSLYRYQIQSLEFVFELHKLQSWWQAWIRSLANCVAEPPALANRRPIQSNRQAFVALLQFTRITGGSGAMPNSVVIVLTFGEIWVLNRRKRLLEQLISKVQAGAWLHVTMLQFFWNHQSSHSTHEFSSYTCASCATTFNSFLRI